jgi:hypothetical protein
MQTIVQAKSEISEVMGYGLLSANMIYALD